MPRDACGLCGPAPSSVPAVRACRGTALRAGWCGAVCWISLLALAAQGFPQSFDESATLRLQRLEQMSDADKVALLDKKHRFDELSTAEQDRLRQLCENLAADPQREPLWQTLERYQNWLRTLTPPERAEVLSLPADQRIERIRELIRAQDAKRFRMMVGGFMMNPKDLNAIHHWFDKFLDDHADEILATLPDDSFAKFKQEYTPDRDRNFLRFLYFRSPDPDLPRPSQQDEAELQTLVSKSAQEVLARASDDEERSRIIQRWSGAAALSRMRTNPSVEELQQFAQESLSDAERFRLESLPRDRMYRELRMRYSQRRFGGDPGRGFPRFPRGPTGPWQPEPGGDPQGPPPGPPPGGPPPWDDQRGPLPPPGRKRDGKTPPPPAPAPETETENDTENPPGGGA